MTKNEQILDPRSDWNQAADDEPVFIIRANNWKAALLVAMLIPGDAAEKVGLTDSALDMREYHESADTDTDTALGMREYHRDNDIPY
jgi:hypothetical protein